MQSHWTRRHLKAFFPSQLWRWKPFSPLFSFFIWRCVFFAVLVSVHGTWFAERWLAGASNSSFQWEEWGFLCCEYRSCCIIVLMKWLLCWCWWSGCCVGVDEVVAVLVLTKWQLCLCWWSGSCWCWWSGCCVGVDEVAAVFVWWSGCCVGVDYVAAVLVLIEWLLCRCWGNFCCVSADEVGVVLVLRKWLLGSCWWSASCKCKGKVFSCVVG